MVMSPALIKSEMNVYKLCFKRLTSTGSPSTSVWPLRGGDWAGKGEQEEADDEEDCKEEEEGRDSGSLHPNAVISFFLSFSLSFFLLASIFTLPYTQTLRSVMSRR